MPLQFCFFYLLRGAVQIFVQKLHNKERKWEFWVKRGLQTWSPIRLYSPNNLPLHLLAFFKRKFYFVCVLHFWWFALLCPKVKWWQQWMYAFKPLILFLSINSFIWRLYPCLTSQKKRWHSGTYKTSECLYKLKN